LLRLALSRKSTLQIAGELGVWAPCRFELARQPRGCNRD
jgi:hypothetical protein